MVSQGLDASLGRVPMGSVEVVTVELPALQAKFSPVPTGVARAKTLGWRCVPCCHLRTPWEQNLPCRVMAEVGPGPGLGMIVT